MIPQFLWFRPVRTQRAGAARGPAIFVNIGMWLERYVIVVTSLHRDFLPSSWGMYHGTFWDYATFYGTIGLFLSLMFLFIRFLPVISITEMRELVHETQEHEDRARRAGGHPQGDRAMKVAHDPTGPYGLMAEFDRPEDLVEATQRRLRARLPDDGGLLAVPGRGAGRGAGVPAQPDRRRSC